jgi:hypothetical protein
MLLGALLRFGLIAVFGGRRDQAQKAEKVSSRERSAVLEAAAKRIHSI